MSSHKIAVVTGASSGIGRSLAIRLAREGFEPFMVARRKDLLREAAGDVEAAGGKAHTLVLDVTAEGAATKMFAAAEKAGTVVALVNNAGFGTYGLLAGIERAESLRMIDLNIRALVDATTVFLPHLLKQKQGYVLNIASTAAFQPIPYQAIYAATKAFVLSFSEALTIEVSGTSVKASCLCPGPTDTEFLEIAEYKKKGLRVPQAVMMSADEVADIGVRGMLKGKAVVIAGFANKGGALATRMVPRGIAARVAGLVFKPRT